MRLLDETKHLLHEHHIRPKRNFGQNFCVNDQLLKRMVAFASLTEEDIVLEIGAGFGFLTRLLSEKAKQVIAVELDPKLVDVLRGDLRNRRNVTIVAGDILEMGLPIFNKIVANPPYSISSPLLARLFEMNFDCAILTLQREVAEKLVAPVGSKDYGFLAVIVNYKTQVDILAHLPRASFYPQPLVESVLVSIRPRMPRFEVIDEELFIRLVRYLFTQRNRKVRNSLAAFLRENNISKNEAKLIAADLPCVQTRVRDMRSEDFGLISDKIYPLIHSKKLIFEGHRFYVFPEVYEPSEDTYLLAEHLTVVAGERVLDMGAGCGLLGILATLNTANVVAADVNPHAVKCIYFNAKLNQVADKVDIRLSDLFNAFGDDEKFDLIIFNPPYLPLDARIRPSKWIERAWYGGFNGRKIIDRFLSNIGPYITDKGRILMVQSSLSNPEESLTRLREMGFSVEVLAEKELFFEKIVVIQAKKESAEKAESSLSTFSNNI